MDITVEKCPCCEAPAEAISMAGAKMGRSDPGDYRYAAEGEPLYLVIKQGVNIQGVWTVRGTQLDARILAQRMAARDCDGYHTWDVRRVDPESGDGLAGETLASYVHDDGRLAYGAHARALEWMKGVTRQAMRDDPPVAVLPDGEYGPGPSLDVDALYRAACRKEAMA